MLSIDSDAAFERALKAELPTPLRDLLLERRSQVWADGSLSDQARLLIIEPGDCVKDGELWLGFPILTNLIDGLSFGDPEFAPSAEWIADHGYAYELVFILDDSGFAHVVFVERRSGVCPRLLALCSRFASAPP